MADADNEDKLRRERDSLLHEKADADSELEEAKNLPAPTRGQLGRGTVSAILGIGAAFFGLSQGDVNLTNIAIVLVSLSSSGLGIFDLTRAGAKYGARTAAIKKAEARARLASQNLDKVAKKLEDSRPPPKR